MVFQILVSWNLLNDSLLFFGKCKKKKRDGILSVLSYRPVANTGLENKLSLFPNCSVTVFPTAHGTWLGKWIFMVFLSSLHTPLGLSHRKMSVPLTIKWRQFHVPEKEVRRLILYRYHPFVSVSRGLRKASLRDGLQWMSTNKYSFP